MANKNVPKRMCVVCREMFDKKELVRIVKSPDGRVFVDYTGKSSGRGAYLCKNPVCAEKCVKQKVLNRVFSKDVSAEEYKKLTEALRAAESER